MSVETTAILIKATSLDEVRSAIAKIANANVEQIALPAPIEGRFIETVTPAGVGASRSYRLHVDMNSFEVEDFAERPIFGELKKKAAGKPLVTVSANSKSPGASVVRALAAIFGGFVRDESVSDEWIDADQK
jgi:hypothetical protein